jgi:hypothetical protein
MNHQYQVTNIKLDQFKAFQAASVETVAKAKKVNVLARFLCANTMQLEEQLAEQKAATQKLIDQKEADALTWDVRRTEWENLCTKIVKERDALKADNERVAAISSRFEGSRV